MNEPRVNLAKNKKKKGTKCQGLRNQERKGNKILYCNVSGE